MEVIPAADAAILTCTHAWRWRGRQLDTLITRRQADAKSGGNK
jgi:hypothetical protein